MACIIFRIVVLCPFSNLSSLLPLPTHFPFSPSSSAPSDDDDDDDAGGLDGDDDANTDAPDMLGSGTGVDAGGR